MKRYNIQTNFKKYDGCGYALAAVGADNNIVEIIYLRDILPYVDFSPEAGFELRSILDDPQIGLATIQLSKFGFVKIGMISCYIFEEL